MKLMLKNKVLMSINAIVKEGIKRGGIPREIQFNPKEATDFLQEYSYLKKEEKNPEFKKAPTTSILIKIKEGSHSKVIFHLNGHLDPEKVKDIVRDWYTGEVSIYYIFRDDGTSTHIPLKVKGNKKTKKPVTISGQLPMPGKKAKVTTEWG